jgi:two-component system sensor histidine kinase/response regulator
VEKLLLIDDQPENLENLKDLLEMEGYNVLMAENGTKGIGLALEEIPDLIISDIEMPDMLGFDVYEILKNEPSTFAIPFLFLSGRSDPNSIRQGMELGADDFITKPFKLKTVLNAVRSRLDKYSNFKKFYDSKIDQLQYAIVYSLPHEMRTPLNSILGFSELINTSIDDMEKDEIKLMAENIHNSGKRLMKIINKFNFYTRLNSLKSVDFLSSMDNPISVDNIIREVATQISKNHDRSSDLELNLKPIKYKILEEHIYQLVEEVVDNAFKFSQNSKKVKISSSFMDEILIIEIFNEGQGISQEFVNSVAAFVQFERSDFEQQGVGLGLAIVKKICEIYNGKLTLKGEPGINAIVKIELPQNSN